MTPPQATLVSGGLPIISPVTAPIYSWGGGYDIDTYRLYLSFSSSLRSGHLPTGCVWCLLLKVTAVSEGHTNKPSVMYRFKQNIGNIFNTVCPPLNNTLDNNVARHKKKTGPVSQPYSLLCLTLHTKETRSCDEKSDLGPSQLVEGGGP